MKFIKKKGDGSWEKLSTREGKTIKVGLEEVVMILEVLKKNQKTWSTVHSFKEDKTLISVNWEGDNKIWFNVGDYPKMLGFAQIEILKLLLLHLLEEKIEFATTSDMPKNQISAEQNETKKQEVPELTVIEEINDESKLQKVEGVITGKTEKALLLKLNSGAENWFPKSTIKSEYSPGKETSQTFLVDSWIIEKNKINIEG
ncbi:MAG: hypothetical protein KAX18_08215 [Candidatus Lokiarchaeota archaeon]|nr:hypothetical protein [Candidatus Lokiarchaeota archaeon]